MVSAKPHQIERVHFKTIADPAQIQLCDLKGITLHPQRHPTPGLDPVTWLGREHHCSLRKSRGHHCRHQPGLRGDSVSVCDEDSIVRAHVPGLESVPLHTENRKEQQKPGTKLLWGGGGECRGLPCHRPPWCQGGLSVGCPDQWILYHSPLMYPGESLPKLPTLSL